MITAQSTRTSKARVGRSLTRRVLSLARDFYADKSGATAVIAAIMFPVVVGGLGLGAETGYWYLTQRKLQHAADLSGHAAGARLRAGDTKTQIDAAALNIATLSGLDLSWNDPCQYASLEWFKGRHRWQPGSHSHRSAPAALFFRVLGRACHDQNTGCCQHGSALESLRAGAFPDRAGCRYGNRLDERKSRKLRRRLQF